MPFTIDDAHLPATLTSQPMTDEEFAELCAEHDDLRFEMTAEGELIVMAPNHFDNSASNLEIASELHYWAKQDGRGYGADSSGGFVLPNGARRSPDASWTLKSRADALGKRKRKSFLHLCPDFVIEVKSESDRWKTLRAKMAEYMEQGTQLGWLIDPASKTVEIYRPGGEVEKLVGADEVSGEGPVAGFVLKLKDVWDPVGD